MIGSLLLRPLDSGTMEIKRMAVADGQQGKGVGRLLVEHGEVLARLRGLLRDHHARPHDRARFLRAYGLYRVG